MKKPERAFFQQKTEIIAQALLGKLLVHKTEHAVLSGMIVETEAYIGPHDLACHVSKGKTTRTSPMFLEGGYWYIYFIYGFYHCANIVTEAKEYPSAVLLRAIEPIDGINDMQKNRNTRDIKNLTNGPGKLCQALKIDKSLNKTSLFSKKSTLFIEDHGITIPSKDIQKTKRIGIDYAGEWKDALLRFYIKNNTFVSKQ